MVSTAAAASTFQDIPPNHWAAPAVESLRSQGIVSGRTPQIFAPDDPITRAEFTTLLVKALKLPLTQNTSQVFKDVNPNFYAFAYIQTAYLHNLVKGTSSDTFDPYAPITRQDMATMIVSALQIADVPDWVVQTSLPFRDVSSIRDYAKKPVAASRYLGVIAGYMDQTFRPLNKATRAEAAGMVYNMLNVPGDKLQQIKQAELKHLAFSQSDYGTYKPTQPVQITVRVNDDKGQLVQTDNNRKLILTVNGPDGQSVLEAATVNGLAAFTVSKTKAGVYSLAVSGSGAVADGSAKFQVVPGDFAQFKMFVSPSPFVRVGSTVQLNGKGYDQWDNEVPLTQGPVQFSVNNPNLGKIGSTGSPSSGTFTAGGTSGSVTVTASYSGQAVSKQITIYNSAADLVSGKGDWMMWRDWHNYPVKDTIQRYKDAGVTHVFTLVSTTSDGFFGQDMMDDFLYQAHDAGITVIGWVYAANKDPYKDAGQTLQVLNYTTPQGQRFDALAADLEENLYQWHQEEFAKSIRNTMGPNYPMIAVVYPATWGKNQPWSVYAKYYDVMAPMLYWHNKVKPYTYQEVYDAVAAEVPKMKELTRPDMPVHIIGQSYNMFDDPNQAPTWEEIQGAMRAAKDKGAIGYSTYRGRTATWAEWAEFAVFNWSK